jgi:hypothetical protein
MRAGMWAVYGPAIQRARRPSLGQRERSARGAPGHVDRERNRGLTSASRGAREGRAKPSAKKRAGYDDKTEALIPVTDLDVFKSDYF